jgi:hypothetical protein
MDRVHRHAQQRSDRVEELTPTYGGIVDNGVGIYGHEGVEMD